MKSFLKKKAFPGQNEWLEKHGDELWTMICDKCPVVEVITYDEAAKQILPHCSGLLSSADPASYNYITSSERQLTRYIGIIIRNIAAEYEQVTDPEIQAMCPIRRMGRNKFILV